jgi:Terminase small subunit
MRLRPAGLRASRLAANGDIRARVAEMLRAAADKAQVTVDRIEAELARVAFSNITDIVSWRSGLVEEQIPDEEGGGTRTVLKSAVTVTNLKLPAPARADPAWAAGPVRGKAATRPCRPPAPSRSPCG